MTTPDLDAIKARLSAATPGPWGLQGAQNDYELRGPGPRVNGWNTGPLVMEVSRWNKHPSPADVALIEHAPADLAALVAEVERLRDELGRATSESFDLGVKSGEGRGRAAQREVDELRAVTARLAAALRRGDFALAEHAGFATVPVDLLDKLHDHYCGPERSDPVADPLWAELGRYIDGRGRA